MYQGWQGYGNDGLKIDFGIEGPSNRLKREREGDSLNFSTSDNYLSWMLRIPAPFSLHVKCITIISVRGKDARRVLDCCQILGRDKPPKVSCFSSL